MKAVRVIRTIAFVVAVIALLVAAAGNFFIVKDTMKLDVSVATIRETLDNVDISFDALLGKVSVLPKAEAEEFTEPEGEPEEGEALEGPVVTEEVPAEEPTEEPTEESAIEPAEEIPSPFVPYKDGNDYLFMLMKVADMRIELPFMDNAIKHIPVIGEGIADAGFEMNLCIVVGFIALTLAFILHLIGKKHATFWGIILMIIGYIIFVAFFAVGQVLASYMSIYDISLEAHDVLRFAMFIRAAFLVLGLFLGLGYFRCGARQMRIVRLKKRLRKQHAAA